MPQSSLLPDTYSPAMNMLANDEMSPYIKYRQQSLIRAWRQDVSAQCGKCSTKHSCRSRKTPIFGSDQYICSHIIIDRELHPEMLRRDAGMEPGGSPGDGHIEGVRV